MSGAQGRREGNYASLEKTPWVRFKNSDLGLTLLPGSQIQRKDEKRLKTTAESSPKIAGSRCTGRSKQRASFETEIQSKYPIQETEFPDEAKSSSSPPYPGSYVTAQIDQESPLFQLSNVQDGSGVVQHNPNPADAVPYDEQKMGTGENTIADSCQHDDHSPRTMKRRKLGSRTSDEIRELKASQWKEAAFVSHCSRLHMDRGQGLCKINDVHSEQESESSATIGIFFGGTRGGSGSSKPVSHGRIKCNSDTALAPSQQRTNLGSEDTAFHGNSPALAPFAPEPRATYRYSGLEKLTARYQSLNHSNISTQKSKYCILPDSAAKVATQVLKIGQEVNRSWASPFPAVSQLPRRTNLPAPSLLAAPYLIDTPETSTNLPAHIDSFSTPPSASLLKNPHLFEAFGYPLDDSTTEDIPDTTLASNQHQSVPRRSASMPNLWSARGPISMDSLNNFEPASMPTPPREKPGSPAVLPYSSSLPQYGNAPPRQNLVGHSCDHGEPTFNANISPSQNWHFNSSIQRQHESSISDRQDTALTSSLPPRQVLTQPFNHQDISSPSVSEDGPMAARGLQHNRRRLEVKPTYSHEEVKSLVFNLVKQAQLLKTENVNLQSSNVAMKKGIESLRYERADTIKQIQGYKRILAQKDRQIEAMQQKGFSLQQQYKQVWDDRNGLVAALRRENGTGNPSAIAQKIRQDHAPHAIDAAGQSNQPSANKSPAYCTNAAHLSINGQRFEQAPTGVQGHVPPVSVPNSSEAKVTGVSSRSLRQHEYTGPNHNNAISSQPMSIPANPEPNEAKASSQALSQPGFATVNHDNAKSSQPVSFPASPAYIAANIANASSRASVQARTANANHNSASFPHDQSTRCVQPNQPFGATAGIVTTNGLNNHRPMGQVPTERVTIDLTDEYQPLSPLAFCDASVHQTPQSSAQGGHSPFDLSSGQYFPAQYPAEYSVSSPHPSGLSVQNQKPQSQLPPNQDSQGTDLKAMRVQREAYARMAEKPLSWLKGENPFRKAAKTEERNELPDSRRSSQSNAEQSVIFTASPGASSVAPLPETATDQKTKMKAPRKTKIVLTVEAKKERAKMYRKTAADKKKQEKEFAKQLIQGEYTLNNAMRAQKQDRRAARGEKRQQQAQKLSGEVGRRGPQTLDGRLYQENTRVQQAVHRGSVDHAPLSDHDSLFGDNEDSQMEIDDLEASPEADSAMHENNEAVEDGVDSAYAAELEALLSADGDAGTMTAVEENDTLGSEPSVPIVPPGGDDGYHDFSEESEESEEE